MAEAGDNKNITWGAAILGAFFITWALIILFGIAPSTYIVTVNKTYGRVPNSRDSRFVRDLVSLMYHNIIIGWLVVGAYQLQKMGTRQRRQIAMGVLLVVPCIVFGLVPSILHGFINAYVASRPAERRASTLYSADLWVYTGYWVATIGLFMLLTPGWIFGLKKIEARFSGEGTMKESAFGRPVVSAS